MIDEKDITCVICSLKDITHEIKQYDYKLQYTSDLELIIYPIHSQSEICLHCLAVWFICSNVKKNFCIYQFTARRNYSVYEHLMIL